MKHCIVVGTRPEIIKVSPIIREYEKRGTDYFLVHSNQHYSKEMDQIFFEELNLKKPKYNLNIGSGSHSNQIGKILMQIEPILAEEGPSVLLVQGDTNTVLAAALCAEKLNIPVAHVEAGLRSYDRTMPEETNRIVTDHLSSFLFAVSSYQQEILQAEGISSEKVFMVGNTIVDAVFQNIKIAKEKSNVLNNFSIKQDDYILLTVHRSSNVDGRAALSELILLIDIIYKKFKKKIIWPMHPRTKKSISLFELVIPNGVIITDPLGYFDFLWLMKNAQVILTDSGGVQEESCILKVPCITLRENTERPETIKVGANVLVGRDYNLCTEGIESALTSKRNWENPFGDGNSSIKILNILQEKLK